jgi:hypothetical protein
MFSRKLPLRCLRNGKNARVFSIHVRSNARTIKVFGILPLGNYILPLVFPILPLVFLKFETRIWAYWIRKTLKINHFSLKPPKLGLQSRKT